MTVSYTKIYQDATTLPVADATGSFTLSNPIPAGLVESFVVVLKGTSGGGGMANSSITSLISQLRITFNGNQWFNFNSLANRSATAGQDALGALVDDIGGFVAENISDTAQDVAITIPCGIRLGANSRFELDIAYYAMATGLTFTGNYELWVKFGNSSNATMVGNQTSFQIPEASQTMMTVAIPSFKGAKVSGIALQGTVVADNLSEVIVQPLGNFGMTPTYLRGASGASQNGYLYKDTSVDGVGLVPASQTVGYYFIPLYDLDVSTTGASVNLLITTVAGAGTENYSAIPVLALPTGGSSEAQGKQTAMAKTGSADAILRRAED
jgi:hypothetical protein